VTHLDKNQTLRQKDRLLIGVILVGCTKMISKIIGSNAKQRTQASSNKQIKSLTYISVLINLPKIVEGANLRKRVKDKPIFRPADIRKELPEGQIRNIQYADLTDILKSLVRTNVLGEIDKDDIKSKRGRLPKNNTKYSGPESYYQATDYYYNLKNVLSKPKAINFIYTLLLESGLLYKYRRYIELFILHIIKNKNYDKKTAWNICKSVFPLTTKERSDFENYYEDIHYINDAKELERLAERNAISYIQKHKAEDYIEIYRIGGYYFKA
jgi:hypothetical protein